MKFIIFFVFIVKYYYRKFLNFIKVTAPNIYLSTLLIYFHSMNHDFDSKN